MNTINTENSTATEDLKLDYNGDEFEIGFNSKYIMDIINNLNDDNITISLKMAHPQLLHKKNQIQI